MWVACTYYMGRILKLLVVYAESPAGGCTGEHGGQSINGDFFTCYREDWEPRFTDAVKRLQDRAHHWGKVPRNVGPTKEMTLSTMLRADSSNSELDRKRDKWPFVRLWHLDALPVHSGAPPLPLPC
jgi:hypothetical protein